MVHCSQPLEDDVQPLNMESGASETPRLTQALSPTPANDLFGKYRIRGVLGKGGMAKVYLVEQQPTFGRHRWCAMKIPEPKYRDTAEFRRMFQTVAALAGRICHPHVCGVLETGDWQGTPFFTMELLRGRSLLAVRKAVNPANASRQHALRVARIIADACEGLQAIHDYGADHAIPPRIVHRDISPDNLFLTTEGFVKILDFGLAQTALIDDEGETELLRGKISYIAPELLQKQVATSKSDVWGLGVVAWELLIGRPLFNEATDYETLAAVRDQQIPAPSELLPGLPAEIDPIILRALQREPSERFESAAEFGRALWDFMVSQGDVAHHADLAEWLACLFPPESDIVASLCALEAPDVIDCVCPQKTSRVRESEIQESTEDVQTAFKQPPKVKALCDVFGAIGRSLCEAYLLIRATLARELASLRHLPSSMVHRARFLWHAGVTPLLPQGQRQQKNLADD